MTLLSAKTLALVVIQTNRAPFRALHRLSHAAARRFFVAAFRRRFGAAVQAIYWRAPSRAGLEFYGLSDLDLLLIAAPQTSAEERAAMAAQWRKLARACPLFDEHPEIHSAAELADLARREPYWMLRLAAGRRSWHLLHGASSLPPDEVTPSQAVVADWYELKWYWAYFFRERNAAVPPDGYRRRWHAYLLYKCLLAFHRVDSAVPAELERAALAERFLRDPSPKLAPLQAFVARAGRGRFRRLERDLPALESQVFVYLKQVTAAFYRRHARALWEAPDCRYFEHFSQAEAEQGFAEGDLFYYAALRDVGRKQASVTVRLARRSEASTLYVHPDGDDFADGSAQTPWRSLQRAADSARAGDTIQVAPGDYQGFCLRGRHGPVTWIASPGARITGGGIELESVSAIAIEGFTIESAARAGIRVIASERITVRGNRIRDCAVAAILVSGGDHHFIVDNRLAGTHAGPGLYLFGPSQGVEIARNRVVGNAHGGIVLSAETGAVVEAAVRENLLYRNGREKGSGIEGGGIQRCRVENNAIHQRLRSAIFLWPGDSRLAASGNFIVGNRVRVGRSADWALRLSDGSVDNRVAENRLAAACSAAGVVFADASSAPGTVWLDNAYEDCR